jgi:hypothetical protein
MDPQKICLLDPDPATGKYSEGKKPRLFFKQFKRK